MKRDIISETDFLSLCSAKAKKDPSNPFWQDLIKVEAWLGRKGTDVKPTFTRSEIVRNQKLGMIDLTGEQIDANVILSKHRTVPYNQLSAYAGSYLKWRGKSIDREGAGEGDWDFGYKVYPVAVLEAVINFIEEEGVFWKKTLNDLRPPQ